MYFFDTFNGKDVLPDDEGRDLPDVATARREAIEDAKELITAAIFRADDIGSGEVRVRHWAGSDPIFSIGFKDVIEGLRA